MTITAAATIISVLKYFGEDITPEQEADIWLEADTLSPVEYSKLMDYLHNDPNV